MKFKKYILLLTVISLICSSLPVSAAYDVSDRARIGIKYGSSAVSSSSFSSTTEGFILSSLGNTDITIGTVNSSKLKASSYNNNGANSYFVVEQSSFESFESAAEYCKNRNNKVVPYYRNNVIYAVMDELYTEDEANSALAEAQGYNSTAYIISPNANRLKLYDASGNGILVFSQDDGEILGVSATNEGLIDFGNQETYRDIIEFKRVGNALNIISNVTMQHYLYSVVPAEIGASAPLEAQKAQAVCARTYFEQNISRHKSDGFNLCGTTHCQMYIGTKWERAQSNQAVDETDNQIATYNGKPISAVYFAHSGGATANVEDVWGNPYPYLKSVEDKYCTDYTWETAIDYSKITTSMNSKGYNLGDVYDIRIIETAENGLVTKLRITGTNGSKDFSRESARTILGLKSQNFTIPTGGINHTAKTKSGTQTVTVKKILTSSGTVEAGDSVTVKNGSNKITSLTSTPGNVIYGKGHGHHVGFSQHGAMEYAKCGWDYITILKHYYQGIEIEGE